LNFSTIFENENKKFVTLIKIKVLKGCVNAGSIAKFSSVTTEDEVLIPPYSVFRIDDIEKSILLKDS
jgi:hypothetical protein